MPSGLEAINQMELSDSIEHIPHRALDGWEFYIENRYIFRVNEPMATGSQPCTLISQPAFLQAVVDRANGYEGFSFVRGTAVRDLLWQKNSLGDRVSGVKLSDGSQIAADLIIGADGRNSIVRQKANLFLAQEAQSFDILWFKLASNPRFESENVFYSILKGREGFGVFQGSTGSLQVGWSLHKDNPLKWQEVDWAEKLASTSPDWLAAHFRQQAGAIAPPRLLSIVVGRCTTWHIPGLIVLGDAAHPMSPIRAQGINMALRDAVVAANYLVPLLQQSVNPAVIDAVLPQIQTEREHEIIPIQRLQQLEVAQAEQLRNSSLMRYGVSRLAPLLGNKIRQSWLKRQLQLRQGFMTVNLEV